MPGLFGHYRRRRTGVQNLGRKYVFFGQEEQVGSVSEPGTVGPRMKSETPILFR